MVPWLSLVFSVVPLAAPEGQRWGKITVVVHLGLSGLGRFEAICVLDWCADVPIESPDQVS